MAKPSPPPGQIIHYPLASSGRPRGLFPSGPGLGPTHHHHHPHLPYPIPRAHPTAYSHIIRHPSSLPALPVSPAVPFPPSTGVHFNSTHHPLPKVGSSTYSGVPENNAPKDLIDKKSDDLLITLRDRKVRLSDGASLYALCRSWLRNGYSEDNQPQHGDVLISLPKPLPLPESSLPKRKEREDETYIDEVEKDDALNAEDLLMRHVKRAKRVRARLREERLQRIERYKSRLSALLPPNGIIQD